MCRSSRTACARYRELPLRLAEFGAVNRYEPSGALHGLMRVRSFTQDDAHIFCTEEQLAEECHKINELILSVYGHFGFDKIVVKLSTRPDKRVGTDAMWDHAEAVMSRVLDEIKARHGNVVTTEPQPGRGRLLRAEVRIRAARRDRPRLAMRHDPGRLQPARALRRLLHRRQQREDDAGDDPSRHLRLDGALHRHPARASRRPSAAVARAVQIVVCTITSDADDVRARIRGQGEEAGPEGRDRPAQREDQLQGARALAGEGPGPASPSAARRRARTRCRCAAWARTRRRRWARTRRSTRWSSEAAAAGSAGGARRVALRSPAAPRPRLHGRRLPARTLPFRPQKLHHVRRSRSDDVPSWRSGSTPATRCASVSGAREVALDRFSPRATVLDWLREETGSEGDEGRLRRGRLRRLHGRAGAADGGGRLTYEAVNACILLLGQLDGAELITIEDLADGDDAASAAAGDGRPSRLAMRLLHARHRDEPVRRLPFRRACDLLRPLRPARRQSLPLHRLSPDPRRGARDL